MRSVEKFLFYEARLLDQGRLEEWGQLFTDDGIYWVPATVDQPDPIPHVSLMSSSSRECIISSSFIVLQNQRDKQAVFGGCYTHTLRWDDERFAIKQKKAELANCEAAHENIHIIL